MEDETITIGKLARRAGVRPSTVRYYEGHRILPAPSRRPSGYRVYSEDSVALLRFIRRAQGFGMSLKEVKQLLTLARQGQRPCERVRELAHEHLRDINLRIRELELLRGQLRGMLRRRATVDHANGTVCPMIEAGLSRSRQPKPSRRTRGLSIPDKRSYCSPAI
jgi:MerR family transcriptional regulator, copper efflux regulator